MKPEKTLSVGIAWALVCLVLTSAGAVRSGAATVRTDAAGATDDVTPFTAPLAYVPLSMGWSVAQGWSLSWPTVSPAAPSLALDAGSDLSGVWAWQLTPPPLDVPVLSAVSPNSVASWDLLILPRIPLGLGPDTGALLAQAPPAAEDQGAAAGGQGAAEDLAVELANPISSLISVPFQQNIEFGIGPAGAGWHDLMNIQPVVPFSINKDWNLIERMIMPVVYQDEIFPGAGSQFGIGDTIFQTFFSPTPTAGGVIWGIGPLFYVPTGAYLISTSTWAAGVDFVALKQMPKPWWGGGIFTYGALITQQWPFSGSAPITTLFMQPFLAYTLKSSLTFTLQSLTTYLWTPNQWTVPILGAVSKVYKFGNQPTSVQFGVKYYPIRPVTAPQWGVVLNITLLFPAAGR